MKTIAFAVCMLLIGISSSQLYEGTTDPFCSLREVQSECHANNNCMFTEVQLDDTYGLEKKPITMCYHKDFIINSMKSTIFPANYDEISHKELLQYAELEADLDLGNPSNIEALVRRLIEQRKIKFIVHFKFLA